MIAIFIISFIIICIIIVIIIFHYYYLLFVFFIMCFLCLFLCFSYVHSYVFCGHATARESHVGHGLRNQPHELGAARSAACVQNLGYRAEQDDGNAARALRSLTVLR